MWVNNIAVVYCIFTEECIFFMQEPYPSFGIQASLSFTFVFAVKTIMPGRSLRVESTTKKKVHQPWHGKSTVGKHKMVATTRQTVSTAFETDRTDFRVDHHHCTQCLT